MKQFIKEHPWRLEIVPLLIFICAIIIPFIYPQKVLIGVHFGSSQNIEEAWLLHYILRLLAIIGVWIIGLQVNHDWVRHERQKRFNFWALFNAAMMVLAVWFLYQWPLDGMWIVFLAAAVILTVIIEISRPFVRMETTPEPVIIVEQIGPGDKLYYREQHKTRWIVTAYLVPSAFILLGLWSVTGRCEVFLVMIPSVAIAAVSRIVFVITNLKITARVGVYGISIPMLNVNRCEIIDYHPLTESFKGHRGFGRKYDGMLTLVPATNRGNCVRIETIDGKAYLLGMENPETACKLINSAIAANKEKEVER